MSTQPINHHNRLGRRVGLLVAAVLTAVVTGGAGFAPPDSDLVTRVLTDPAGTLDQVADETGLDQPAAAGQQLKGLFKVDPTSCNGGPVTGSYFRMVQPGGSHNGPFVENNDTTCSDKSYTDLAPGTDGGLSTTGHQPNPDPAFDAAGSGTSGRITAPKGFYGTKFAASTNPKDPQSGKDAPVPTIVNDNGKLSGNLSAFSAAWNRQHFNQGSPKPDNTKPGLTAGPTGTYDAATKHFVLEWSSTIVGGAFNNFTGIWRLEGTFQPAGGKASRQLAAQVTVAQTGGGALKGLFRVNPASCSGPQVSGSYFRMIQPGGTKDGPWVSNNDSVCADKTYTDLTPGRDGGLSTTGFQPQPGAAFDVAGSGTADRIVQPKGFFGTKFAAATNEKDPQTNSPTTVPEVVFDGAGKLSGNVSAYAAAWNNQHFNQGAPKPDGSKPGLTSGPDGTLDPTTKKFTLEWTTTIVGGPFNNFTGKWHFEGVYEGALPAAVGAPPASGGSTTTGPATGGPASGGSATTGSATTGSATTGSATSASGRRSTTGGATAPVANTAADSSTTGGAAMARTGLRLSPSLPAALIGLGLICRRVGRRRPRTRR
jgi:hypothetical protein